MKVAVISDLHFLCKKWYWKDFFSKRWIGKFNSLFSRRQFMSCSILDKLASKLTELAVDLVFVSGDISSVSSINEFSEAKNYFLEKIKAKTLFIPGNHDCYTSGAKSNFYRFFSNDSNGKFSLSKDRVEMGVLNSHWNYLLLDSTVLNWPFISAGAVSNRLRNNICNLLKKMDDREIIVINHFPLKGEPLFRKLFHADRLEKILSFDKRISLYISGHSHKVGYCASPGYDSIQCGSSSNVQNGSFILIELENNHYKPFFFQFSEGDWKPHRVKKS